jgi:sialidase-1
MANKPFFREIELFTSGAEGYHTFRIPGMAVANDGTILAFAEGRKDGHDDYHAMYLTLKRSTDNGATWEDLQVLVGDGERTHHNPTPVVDRETGTVHLLFNIDAHRVLVMTSDDSGATWSDAVDVTDTASRPDWFFYALAPGHGIQRKDGTLVVPANHIRGHRHDWIFSEGNVITSDDHGATWNVGGSLPGGSNECEVEELTDGTLYMAVRAANRRKNSRYASRSTDGGMTWSELEDVGIVDAVCQASISRFTTVESGGKNRVLFSNANSVERKNLAVRMSYDECDSWPVSKVIYPGPVAYSELAIAADNTICCFYERGLEGPYESIRFAQFNVEWLTDGADGV